MAASPVDYAVNANNVAQRYVLWGNGRIDAYGGAPEISGQTTWYDSLIPMPVAVALHITNWATGAGYVLDLYGGFHAFNGAAAISQPPGVPYVAHSRNYVDWAWHPAGNGQGYALSVYGQIHEFGGATPAPRQGARWSQPFAKKFAVSWDGTLRAITLDAYGGLHADFGASVTAWSAYWPHRDAARDFVVTTWSGGAGGGAQGHVLDKHGGVHEFGGAPDTHGWPYNLAGDVARCLAVISTTSPQRFWQVWSGGQQFEYVSSSPPTVTAGGSAVKSPAATVTGTTRPVLAWAYSDPQADAQKTWQLLVFTQAFVNGHDMSDPFAWRDDALVVTAGTDPSTRGVVADLDFPNGSYRMYVAVQDAADQWSAWSSHGWAQNVSLPATPTGLSATAEDDGYRVHLSVSAATDGSAELVRFQCSDGGSTWRTVRGAGAVPIAATTTATDYDPPQGITRTYRAIAYALDPAVASAPSNTDTAFLPPKEYVLTATDDPTLGGVVRVVEAPGWSRPVEAGTFQGLGAEYPIVVSDGAPKARRQTLGLEANGRDEWMKIDRLLLADSVLVLRDPFGDVVYCRVVGDWSRRQLRVAPFAHETTPFRHIHTTALPLVEVAPPGQDG